MIQALLISRFVETNLKGEGTLLRFESDADTNADTDADADADADADSCIGCACANVMQVREACFRILYSSLDVNVFGVFSQCSYWNCERRKITGDRLVKCTHICLSFVEADGEREVDMYSASMSSANLSYYEEEEQEQEQEEGGEILWQIESP
ncbi:hypothetical protein V1478_000244 [Vespula squamosa]|uniref:Uncharacterized protein n=1 Tax=Vespula squamosa TaxID=30214 RepID=A0ABD2C6Y9_VESSQ